MFIILPPRGLSKFQPVRLYEQEEPRSSRKRRFWHFKKGGRVELVELEEGKERIAKALKASADRVMTLDSVEQVYAHLTLLKIYTEKVRMRIDTTGRMT